MRCVDDFKQGSHCHPIWVLEGSFRSLCENGGRQTILEVVSEIQISAIISLVWKQSVRSRINCKSHTWYAVPASQNEKMENKIRKEVQVNKSCFNKLVDALGNWWSFGGGGGNPPRNHKEQWFSKHGFWTGSLSFTGELIRKTKSWDPTSDLLTQTFWGWGSSICVVISSLGDSDAL